MHLALMEPSDAKATDQVAALCAESGTSLHIIGPTDLPMKGLEAQEGAGELDLWQHPDWFEFRRAIARERCYYFTPEGGKTIDEARLRPTSVLMFSSTGELPARIIEKYPHRLYKLPVGGVKGIEAVLKAALAKVGDQGSGLGARGADEAPKGGRRGGARRGGRGRSKE